jgi:hypothetical protein
MLATVLQAAGLAVVAIGVGLWFVPAGIIVAGIGCLLFGLALERK